MENNDNKNDSDNYSDEPEDEEEEDEAEGNEEVDDEAEGQAIESSSKQKKQDGNSSIEIGDNKENQHQEPNITKASKPQPYHSSSRPLKLKLPLPLVSLMLFALQRGVDCRRWFAPDVDEDSPERSELEEKQIQQGNYCLTRKQFEQRLQGLALGLGAGMGVSIQKEIESAISMESLNVAMHEAAGDLSPFGEATIHLNTFLKLCAFPDDVLPQANKQKAPESFVKKCQDDSQKEDSTKQPDKAAQINPTTPQVRQSGCDVSAQASESHFLDHQDFSISDGDSVKADEPLAVSPFAPAFTESPENLCTQKEDARMSFFNSSDFIHQRPRSAGPTSRKTGLEIFEEVKKLVRQALCTLGKWEILQELLFVKSKEPERVFYENDALITDQQLYEAFRKIGVTLTPAEVTAFLRGFTRCKAGEKTPTEVTVENLAAFLVDVRFTRRTPDDKTQQPSTSKKYPDFLLPHEAWVKDKRATDPKLEFKKAIAGKAFTLSQADADEIIENGSIPGIMPFVPDEQMGVHIKALALGWFHANHGFNLTTKQLHLHKRAHQIRVQEQRTGDIAKDLFRAFAAEEGTKEGKPPVFVRSKDGKSFTEWLEEKHNEHSKWDSMDRWLRSLRYPDMKQASPDEASKLKLDSSLLIGKIRADPQISEISSKIALLLRQLKDYRTIKHPEVVKLKKLKEIVEAGPDGTIPKVNFLHIVIEEFIEELENMRRDKANITAQAANEDDRLKFEKLVNKTLAFAMDARRQVNDILDNKKNLKESYKKWKKDDAKRRKQRQRAKEEEKRAKEEEEARKQEFRKKAASYHRQPKKKRQAKVKESLIA